MTSCLHSSSMFESSLPHNLSSSLNHNHFKDSQNKMQRIISNCVLTKLDSLFCDVFLIFWTSHIQCIYELWSKNCSPVKRATYQYRRQCDVYFIWEDIKIDSSQNIRIYHWSTACYVLCVRQQWTAPKN